MKLPECFGKFGFTDDCFGCLYEEDCEAESIDQAEDYGLDVEIGECEDETD